MDFIHGMLKATNIDYTANGAKSLSTSGSFLVDFFSKSGALRGQENDAVRYFIGAYSENKELALKSLFYTRDVRGGQGERDIFRACLRYVALNYPTDIAHLVELIPEYGRWDDLYILIGTKLEETAFEIMKTQFIKDLKSESPSLLGKWLKSVNTSSKASRNLGRYTAKKFGLNEPKYRKALAKLRKKIDILEKRMSGKDWENITYSKVPSQAIYKHKTAFYRHDKERFEEYLNKVTSGEEEIKTETLYPYQIVQKVRENSGDIQFYDNLWNNLPNFMSEEDSAIAVVDTSGSMQGGPSNVKPIDVALSLGIYFAERNEGMFKNTFITFSRRPALQQIVGNNIYEKVHNLKKAAWDMNTDLHAVFETILDTAIDNDLKQEEIPNKIYIISDMQFDMAFRTSAFRNTETNFEAIDNMYLEAGYQRPALVFWNVNAYSDVPVEKDEHGTYLVSGASPSILKYAMNCESVTPYQLMLDVLHSPRYEAIAL